MKNLMYCLVFLLLLTACSGIEGGAKRDKSVDPSIIRKSPINNNKDLMEDSEYSIITESEKSKKSSITSPSADKKDFPDTVHKLNIPKAGEHDDNEEFQYFISFLNDRFNEKEKALFLIKDIEKRFILTVVDKNGLALKDVEITMDDQSRLTYQDGEAIFYPDTKIKQHSTVKVFKIRYLQSYTNISIDVNKFDRYEISIDKSRVKSQEIAVDIVFVMDTTGSMGDEISMLQDTLFSINSRVKKLPVSNIKIRFGMVLYRDQGDRYLTKSFQLTDNLNKFQNFLFAVEAGGGGDTPEDLIAGMKDAVNLNWNQDAIKLVFLITDAPAKPDGYRDLFNVISKSVLKTIKVYSIGASGLDITGEGQLRMLSQMTKGKFIFLTYGESGDSEGGDTETDPGKVSHHTGENYESRSLDDIVVDNVKKEIYTQADKLTIAQLNKDYDYTSSKDLIYRRVDNALQQIKKQLSPDKIGKMTVMILDPAVEDASLIDLSKHISDVSEKIILQDKFLKVVDRKNMDAIMKELQLNMAGVTSTTEIDQLTQADSILAGKLYFVGSTSVFMIRLIDVKSSEVIAAAMIKI